MTQGTFNAFDLSRAGARHRGAATLTMVVLLAAGCGGGGKGSEATQLSKPQYEARIQKDGQAMNEAFKPLSTPPSSLDQLASSIKKGQDKLRQIADDLDSAKPPADVAKDNAVLVAGLRKPADQPE